MAAARLALCLLIAAGPALSQEAGLPVIPRTADEATRIAAVLQAHGDPTETAPFEHLPGGAATVSITGRMAFSQPAANLPAADQMNFRLGQALFRKLWVAAPASTLGSDGLGPLSNARSCQACHRGDGRGQPPDGTGMVLRLTGADPVYGRQLQDAAAPGQMAEGRISVSHTEFPVTLGDGMVVTLQRPAYAVAAPGYGALDPAITLSPRLAPPLIGLGLLEAVPAADILALADDADADGDGISGRAQILPDGALGRFGHRAEVASLRAQAAQALADDMGLSNPLRPDPWGDCTPAQTACRAAPHGQMPGMRDGLEVDGQSLDLITLYSRSLAVPARRSVDDPQVLRGKALFGAANCTGCHVPAMVTARIAGQPERSFQLIWPYSDLLLHDMGEGLADGAVGGAEWRTPPLWGLGLTEAVSGETRFLHDGRARSLTEAILWHGGEAAAAREAFVMMHAPDRAAILAFLESL